MFYNQAEYDLRCEWGRSGLERLGTISDVVIIVDVLSFSTCVDLACGNGALVFPYRWKDQSALEYAESRKAKLASFERQSAGFSLSPSSIGQISVNTKLVLPSPNGSTLSLLSKSKHTLTGCLRNCEAIAKYASRLGKSVAVIPAGEKWADGTLRPAIEDLIGAGAIINYLTGTMSPEAEAALSAFQAVRCLASTLLSCSSGKELLGRGFKRDVELAARFNCSAAVPELQNEVYINLNFVDR